MSHLNPIKMSIGGNPVRIYPRDDGTYTVRLTGDNVEITKYLTEVQKERIRNKLAKNNIYSEQPK